MRAELTTERLRLSAFVPQDAAKLHTDHDERGELLFYLLELRPAQEVAE